VIAIIAARGGSKRVPKKNLRPLAGKPLIAFSIEAALSAGIFSDVVVTTEDDEIAEAASRFGASAIARPLQFARDDSPSWEAIVHVLEQPQFEKSDSFCLLQPTSPLRTARHIAEAHRLFAQGSGRPVVSCTRPHAHPYKCLVEIEGAYRPVLALEDLESPDQSLPRALAPNGAIYMAQSLPYRAQRSFFRPLPIWYEMAASASIDINAQEDFAFAEFALSKTAQG
jgi:CMP-N-acetylneuraminic acid synthetase